jgi:uncharacterized protein
MLKVLSAVLALVAVLTVSPVSAEELKLNRMISVSGHGEVSAAPDLATVTIGVFSPADTAREALDANSKAMTKLIDVLKKAGVEAKDMTTSNFNVGPRYDYNNNSQPPKVVGYDVNNSVTVIVRKVDDLGNLLDVAVSAGSNQINGVAFSVSKPEEMLDAARKDAVADARRKAEVYAAAGGFKLGDIISLSEGPPAGPQPILYQTRAKEAADAVPIAQGEQTLSIDVQVTYTIK